MAGRKHRVPVKLVRKRQYQAGCQSAGSERADKEPNKRVIYAIPERADWTLDDWIDYYEQYGESTEGYVDVYDDEDDD